MTNSEQAIREFAEKWGYTTPFGEWHEDDEREELMSDLTALISEHYVSREEHEKMKHNLTHCGSCGDPLSRDCPRCKHLWET